MYRWSSQVRPNPACQWVILKQERHSAKDVSTLAIGAAYGTAKAGIGITGLGIMRPDAVMKVSGAWVSDSAIFDINWCTHHPPHTPRSPSSPSSWLELLRCRSRFNLPSGFHPLAGVVWCLTLFTVKRVLSYGLVVSVLIIGGMDPRKPYSLFAFESMFPHLWSP